MRKKYKYNHENTKVINLLDAEDKLILKLECNCVQVFQFPKFFQHSILILDNVYSLEVTNPIEMIWQLESLNSYLGGTRTIVLYKLYQ